MPDFQNFKNPKRNAKPLKIEGSINYKESKILKSKKRDSKYPLLLCTSTIEHTYRGIPITDWVKGAKKIFPERLLEISPDDARKFGIEEGKEVRVSSKTFEKVWPVRITPDISCGMIHITLPPTESISSNPYPVNIRMNNV